MKSTLEAEKTARVHRLFGASNYVNRADKAEKFSGNSSVFKWKTERYLARREPNIMDIESTTCVLEVPHASEYFHSLAS